MYHAVGILRQCDIIPSGGGDACCIPLNVSLPAATHVC